MLIWKAVFVLLMIGSVVETKRNSKHLKKLHSIKQRKHHIAHVHKNADRNSKKSELYEKPGARVTINEDSQGSMIDESATDDGEIASTKHDIARNEKEQHSDEFKTCTDAACDESGEVDTSEWVILKKHRNKNAEATNYVSENDASEKTSIENEPEQPIQTKNSSLNEPNASNDTSSSKNTQTLNENKDEESVTKDETSVTKDEKSVNIQPNVKCTNESCNPTAEETSTLTNKTFNKTDHDAKETDEGDDVRTASSNNSTIMDQLANAVEQNIKNEGTTHKENCTDNSCFATEEKEGNNEETNKKDREENNDTESALTESSDKDPADEKEDNECTDAACSAPQSQMTDSTGESSAGTKSDDNNEESESTEQSPSPTDVEINKDGNKNVTSSISNQNTELENAENKENSTFVRDELKNETKQAVDEKTSFQNDTKADNAGGEEGETKSKNECTDAACMAPAASNDQKELVSNEEQQQLANEPGGSGSDEQDLQDKQNDTKKVQGLVKEKLTVKPTTEDESDNVNIVEKKKEKATNETISLLPSTIQVHKDESDKSVLDNGTAEFLSEVLPKTSENQDDSTGKNGEIGGDKKHANVENNSTTAEHAKNDVQTKQGDSRTVHPHFMKNQIKFPKIHKVQSVSD